MSTETTKFAWKDRDTAASDMLQLARYAPRHIRKCALQLLAAFRSTVIFPEMEQLVLDKDCDHWERRDALRAIGAMPGDIYAPQFAPLAAPDSPLTFEDWFAFANQHPSNLDWVFRAVEQLPPQDYLAQLCRADKYDNGEVLNSLLYQRMRDVIDLNPNLLDLEVMSTQYHGDGSEKALDWLDKHWDAILQLCVTSDMDDVIYRIEDWDKLRQAVFDKRPSIIDAYEYRQARFAARALERQKPPAYLSSPLWLELNGLYQRALEGDREAYNGLARIVNQQSYDVSKRAVATHLLGRLKDKYDVRGPLKTALFALDDHRLDRWDMNASVRMEACQAIRDIPTPDVWEWMVDAYFYHPRNTLEILMEDSIAHLTDRLSGIEKEYSGMHVSGEGRWFNDLAETHEESQPKPRQRFVGFSIFIMYESDSAPAHIHLRRESKSAKVRLDPVEFEQMDGFGTSEQEKILSVISEHQAFLLKQWNRLHPLANTNDE